MRGRVAGAGAVHAHHTHVWNRESGLSVDREEDRDLLDNADASPRYGPHFGRVGRGRGSARAC